MSRTTMPISQRLILLALLSSAIAGPTVRASWLLADEKRRSGNSIFASPSDQRGSIPLDAPLSHPAEHPPVHGPYAQQPLTPPQAAPRPPSQISDAARLTRDQGQWRVSMNLRNEDLRALLDFLSKEAKLNIVASDNVKGAVTASFADVSVDAALAAILKMTGYVSRREGEFLYVGTPADLKRMDQLQDEVEKRLYRTNYVTAAELQQLITPMLTEGVGVVTVSSPANVDIPADTVKTGGDSFAGNEVLLVSDYRSVLRQVDELVKQVDQRPRQVIIEAMILSVNLDDMHKFGINFEFLKSDENVRLVSGSPLGSLGQIDVAGGGLNFGVLNGDIGSFIHALESIGDTNVVAAPRLLCLNKQRAEILIGDQKGFISTTQTETSTTQTVEFLDIGTQLRIRPFISDDGVVRLETHPELSTGDVRLLGDFALPEKSVTQVTTNIMCRDGATVVIGGLIREDFSDSVSQVAGIGSIPVLGNLFRNRTETVARNEIIVLITPRIIHDPAEMDEAHASPGDVFDRQASIDSRRISPIARHHYSERYYRLAHTAWLAGNPTQAMRYLELSLQFKPRNRRSRHLYGVVSSALGDPIVVEGVELPVSGDATPELVAPPVDLPSPQPRFHQQPAAPVLRHTELETRSETSP